MNSLAKEIQSVLYTRTWFNPAELKLGYKVTYEVLPSGKVTRRYYHGTSRKISEKTEWQVPTDRALSLFNEIVDCLHSADRVTGYVDDCGATVKLEFWDGSMELPRGLGTAEKDVGRTMELLTNALERQNTTQG